MEPSTTICRSSAVAWSFLGAFVVLDGIVLWPEDLTGWRFAAVVAGALVGAVVVTRRGRVSRLLWSVSGSLMGGMNVLAVFHWPFGVRRDLGLTLLVALFVFSIVQESPRRARSADF